MVIAWMRAGDDWILVAHTDYFYKDKGGAGNRQLKVITSLYLFGKVDCFFKEKWRLGLVGEGFLRIFMV